jgi:hypothetical protein
MVVFAKKGGKCDEENQLRAAPANEVQGRERGAGGSFIRKDLLQL